MCTFFYFYFIIINLFITVDASGKDIHSNFYLIVLFLSLKVNGKLRRTWRRQVRERITSRTRRMTLTLNQTLSLRSDIDYKYPRVSNQQEELQFLKAADGNSTIINGDLKKSNCSIADV